MLTPYLFGVGALVGLALAWAGVQSLWRHAFPDAAPGGDALAGRLGCHGCDSCDKACEGRPADEAGPAREERS
ncbi:MAG: hypothetical protein F9K18_02625 [Thermoanaerobaculia bacterium]|nr:MAG: hypothetical protein F9K18_02625 [Thermoanaerobaculia bacterium]